MNEIHYSVKPAPEIIALQQENKQLTHRIEVLESMVFAAKEMLTLEEASSFLGVKKSQLYKMTHTFAIPFFKPNGKMVYFDKSDLLEWLRSNRIMSKVQTQEAAREYLQNAATK